MLLTRVCNNGGYETGGLVTSTANRMLVVLTLQEHSGHAVLDFSAEYAAVNASQGKLLLRTHTVIVNSKASQG